MPPLSKMIQGKFKILSNKKVGLDYFKMAICAPQIARKATPGQFVHLRCLNSTEPLLRRPFSFHKLNHNNFEILYKVKGLGTNLLAKKRKGDKIDVLGPLGNGFDIQQTNRPTNQQTILVAGGMGVAPLLALAERLADRKKIVVLLGAKNKKQILCERDFKRLSLKVQVATDNGTKGHKGFITDLLKKILRTMNNQLRTIYACGPKPMLEEIAHITFRNRIFAQGSLEQNMACGVGACLGCAIKTKAGYKRVCKDGPVFNLREIKW